MNARRAVAALWAAVSCLPRSDDLGAYSTEWVPGAGGSGSGGVAGSANAAGASGAAPSAAGNAGREGVVGGGSLPLDGRAGFGGASLDDAGVVDASGGTGTADEACADGIVSADASRCYLVSSVGAAWQDARDECEALRASLVKVETAEEDALLDTLLSINFWLGASDTVVENVFVWADGTPIEFGNWGPNQPDRFPGPDCVEKRDSAGRQWFDQPCDNLRAFVCERPIER